MSGLRDLPWLTILGVVPLVGALVLAALPAAREKLAKQVALAFSLVVLVLTIVASAAFEPGGDRFQFVQAYDWIPAFGVQYAVGADGIALALIALIAVLVPVVVLASWNDADAVPEAVDKDGNVVPSRKRSVRTFFALVLVLEALLIGVFAATDVFLFYVFFEAMLIPMYFLIGSYGGPRRSYAAMKFLLYSLFGGLLMLVSVIGLFVLSDDAGDGTFAFEALRGLEISTGVEIALFLGFFIAFAIKAPLWPFHTWLPDAGAEAPVGTAVLLVGVMDKVGTFGFLRYCLPLFPEASRILGPYVIALAVIGILYGALLAMGQKDLKRLVSYTSVAHFGFIALGVFAFTSQAQTGAVLYMVAHGLSTGALFLVVGFLISRGHSRFISDYSGVAAVAPVLAGVFLVAGLASLALPGLVTFVGEFLVLLGTFARYPFAAVLATLGIILAALYVLIAYQRTMQGPLLLPHGLAPEKVRDLRFREAMAVGPLIAMMLVLGFYPKPLIDVITPAVEATMQDSGRTDPEPTVGELAAPNENR
jgi:NADH-quinone oxidoreductase subunit M